MPEKTNLLPSIFSTCQQLLADYFQNKEFLKKLEDYSQTNKEQLNIFNQLSEISGKLQIEATKHQASIEDAQEIKNLIK